MPVGVDSGDVQSTSRSRIMFGPPKRELTGSRRPELRATLASEAFLDVVDAGLELRDAVLQLGEVALENLATARLVGESCLDPPQGLKDRLVLILEPLEPLVNRIEVSEHLLSQLGEHLAEPGELSIDVGELPTEELDELPIFGRGHESSLSQVAGAFKSLQWETWASAPEACL